METTSHLRRMAEELKCPICLSLLKSAVSLTCNHIFCNVCIDKYMKSDSTCPVCKVPYRRKGHENQIDDGVNCGSKTTNKACRGTPNTQNTQNQRKNKGKTMKGSSKRTKRCDSDIERPSFPTKKRIQVPQPPPQETPTRPANLESGKSEVIKDRTQTNVFGPEVTTHLHENGDTLFSPFFWLRNEEDTEEATQPIPFDPVNESPPDATCFSDIKDSYDDHPSHITSKDGNMFDSEIFEWTQRPCSPELCASPMKMQDKKSDGCDIVQENGHNNMHRNNEINNIEVVLPTLSPLNEVHHEAKVKGFKKRAKKTRESTQKKRVKRDVYEVVGICTVPPKADQDNGRITSESVKCKKQKQGGKKIATAIDDEASNHGDGSIVGLSNSLNLKKFSDSIHDACSTDKKKKETTNQQHTKRTKRLKNQDSRNSNNNIAELNKNLISQLPSEPSLVNDKIEACASSKQTAKGQVSKGLKTSKKVKFSTNEPTPYKNVATKVIQPLGEVKCSYMTESNSRGKSNATFLHKCNSVSDIHCAFCQSSEESNISGCMAHYLKGKPITLDHEGVPHAIHAHRNCTEWAPNVYFDDDTAVNLEAELARSKRIKCSCCGLKGAALGCYEKSCRKSFHFTCAKLTPQCRWDDDNFVMLCPFHASQKLPNEACGSQLKDKKKYVPKRQAIIKQSQVNVDDTAGTTSCWESHGLFTKMLICCSALTSTEKEPKLFNGFKFYFTGDFVASYKGYLHDLIIAAGGVVLHRKPIPVNNEQQFLIYSIELPDKLKAKEQNLILSQRKSNAETLANSCDAVAVSNSWILNSIAASKVQNLD
ncbi:hypothetical protein L1987_28832 [Smallanthus sonchifolius]|uniref:Uncharacterized protein n=1 Tax=Smallanthus sonchifolius TaxID=185202 RepID=A0ACB9HXP5_9ASTR|nr:hypothetical protein L1987_28832 [Smallanthus sonchifolius]